MVAGKNNSQALAKAASTPKLPPVPKLRVRRPNRADQNPCIGVMSTVLGKVICATPHTDKKRAWWALLSTVQLTIGWEQAVGRHKATWRKGARRWSSSFALAWM